MMIEENVGMLGAFALVPILMIITYIALVGFTIWFCVSLIKAQRERNQILKDISARLNQVNLNKKE
ncbi:hypothetical protein [Robertmurraya massiliosenegalensis]|nr:hypothetical protein [Robertmurraya massiliosenegalensis]